MPPERRLGNRRDAVPWRYRVGLGIPLVNFVSIHYACFILVPLICSFILWGSSNPKFNISYVDSLFLVVSASTETGLNTVDLSTLTTGQQVLLFLLILCGGTIWVSIWLIVVRRHSFKQLLQADRSGGRETPRWAEEGVEKQNNTASCENGFELSTTSKTLSRRRSMHHSMTPISAINSSPATAPLNAAPSLPASRVECECNPLIFLARKSVGQHGRFKNLSSEERKQVSSIEYEALNLLSLVVPLYFAMWQLVGCLGLGAWIANNLPGPALANGINPWWLGIFNGVSAFSNSGMSLLDANVVPYQRAYYVLVTMSLMILAGNTAYPVFLRVIFWIMLKILKALPSGLLVTKWRQTVEYILMYPRRVYTNLFPAHHTWWLAFMVLLLNSIDWAAFERFNIENPAMQSIPPGPRLLDGLFQAIAVRSGGFYVVPIAQLHIGLLVLYVIMMYISAFPVIITMRHSNIYEERSLSLYSPNQPTPDAEGLHVRKAATNSESRFLFVLQQVNGQLAHDIWLLALAVFIITSIEEPNFSRDPVSYSVFNILFEVVSAYGCVGISVGLPNKNYSFSGGWHSTSKLVLCVVMLRGRHRGLPATMDHAVCLAGKRLPDDEQESESVRRATPSS
ncbi:hypothetical protein QQS21_002143 [Conoideocrella luteorostrata]|uniref:Cation transporter n=1 Tax=Conoideocrella luteorostrata TaxID=1105319 RepID=A0AAJ0FWW3_9HYPO|nr:hypothetical protein QQS21_002143 [Conoideocrella luteorostrata]